MYKYILFTLLMGMSCMAFSQNDTIKLNEVKVKTTANPVVFNKTTRFIQVIPQRQVKAAPVNTLSAVLKQLAGFDVRQRGVFGMQSDLSIRGGSFDQNVILLNGVPVNDPQTGHNNLNFSMAPDNIKKIEVIQGPASRWFGPNAFSGGVNIITEPDHTSNLKVHLLGGQYGLFSGLVTGNYHVGKVHNLTSVHYSRSGGYQRDTDFKNAGFYHQSEYQHKQTKMQLQLSYQDKAYGAYGFYTAQFPDQFEHTRNLFSSFQVSTGKKVKWNATIAWRRMYDRFELFRQGKGWYEKQGDWYIMGQDSAGFHTPVGFFPYTGPNFHRTDVMYGHGQMRFSSKLGKTAVDISYKREHIYSNVLGTSMSKTIHSSFDKGAYYNHQAERNNFNLSANQLYVKGDFSVSAGFNLFYNQPYGLLFSPGLDLGYFINTHWKIFASANRAIRLPTFTDLYYQGPDHISNPALKPEEVTGLETGLKYLSRQFVVTASVFNRMGVNMIDWVKADPQAQWKSENITRLNTYGFALSAVYHADPASAWVRAAGINYTYLNSNKSASGYISLYALDYLKHNLDLFIDHQLLPRLSASWTLQIQKRNGSYFDYTTSKQRPYETVVLLNGKINYRLHQLNVFVQGENLLNKRYHDIGSVLLPGLWITGGIQYRFDFSAHQ